MTLTDICELNLISWESRLFDFNRADNNQLAADGGLL